MKIATVYEFIEQIKKLNNLFSYVLKGKYICIKTYTFHIKYDDEEYFVNSHKYNKNFKGIRTVVDNETGTEYTGYCFSTGYYFGFETFQIVIIREEEPEINEGSNDAKLGIK